MKKIILYLLIIFAATAMPVKQSVAQIAIAEIIKAGVKKVIKAVDLKVQRLQNKTIWLQNVQKVAENAMSKLRLEEITNWVKQQKDLYSEYYDGLWKVKNIISYYHKIKDITRKQAQLVSDYRQAWHIVRKDKHFTQAEIIYMTKVYGGILNATAENIEQLTIIITSFATQMSDAKRMQIVDEIEEKVDENSADLHAFNTQNAILSLQRSIDETEVSTIKWMYGLQ